MIFIHFDFADFSAGHRLFAPQPGHPSRQTVQGAVERLDFAHGATQLALFDRIVKKVEPPRPHHILNLQRVRKIHFNADAVARPDRVHAIVSLLIEPAGVESENAKIAAAQPVHHVDQHRLLGLE